jgi:uncharacterized protein (TIGR00297 family)
VLSQLFGIFDLKGGIGAAVIGGIIVFSTDIEWLSLMLIFAIASFIVTRMWFSYKKNMQEQEGKHGERGVSNVFYAGLIGVIIAVASAFSNSLHLSGVHFFELFAVSFAVITSDTFASEVGVIDSNVRLITSMQKVSPGTNGGISLTGTVASIIGALIIGVSFSLLAYEHFILYKVLFITAMGFLGNLVDSLLGATLERAGRLTKGTVNLYSSLFAVVLSLIILTL